MSKSSVTVTETADGKFNLLVDGLIVVTGLSAMDLTLVMDEAARAIAAKADDL